jgi:hypothetical protein
MDYVQKLIIVQYVQFIHKSEFLFKQIYFTHLDISINTINRFIDSEVMRKTYTGSVTFFYLFRNFPFIQFSST